MQHRFSQSTLLRYETSITYRCIKTSHARAQFIKVFAKLNKFQKSKTNWKWVGGSRSHSDKKKGKSSKNKVLRLYNSPLAESMHSECDSAPRAKKPKVYKTCNVCPKAFPSAHYLTKHKQEAGTRRNRQYGRVCLLTLRYSHIQMMESILICRNKMIDN